jgi:hypothetical protein
MGNGCAWTPCLGGPPPTPSTVFSGAFAACFLKTDDFLLETVLLRGSAIWAMGAHGLPAWGVLLPLPPHFHHLER